MLRLSCFALLVGIVLGVELTPEQKSQWHKFKSEYGKKYSGDEEMKRMENFRINVEKILEHNLEYESGKCDFNQGVNEFSDMTHEEFVENMCGVKGPRTHAEKRTNREVFTGSTTSERADLPDSVDWRDKNAVTPVKNQGTQCGSCWAFSASGAIEGAWALAKGQLISLSAQQLVDCADDQDYDCSGCGGGWPDEAMRYVVVNKGQDRDDCYVYQDGGAVVHNYTCRYNASCMSATISKSVDVQAGSEAILQEAVATIAPISICMNASSDDFQNYKSGIYNPSNCSMDTDHAVLLVGYGSENGTDFWLVKNSWGESWGEEGYFRIIRNGMGTCGITTASSYAVV